jgi:hypothetical protein
MAGGIFLIRDDGELVQFTAELYETEAALQAYVERYPDLLAGDQIDAESPRRWVLVRRELPLAREEGGAGWWSVDHVFLDQDAIPTFVEVKRSSDTRIRREVIGQMMEYAAHAVLYWPVEKMRAEFEATCERTNADPRERLATLLGVADDTSVEGEVETFWERAKENLEQGHLRLLFVADVFPPETKRIIEFLNEKMSDVEVLAVEIRQFTGDGQPILVPRLYGQSEVTRQRKSRPKPSRAWDESAYFELLEAGHPDLVAPTRRVYDWALARGLAATWGTGSETGSLSLRVGRSAPRIASLFTDGRIEFAFGSLKAPFDDLGRRRDLVARFAAIEGFRFPDDAETRYPSAPLSLLGDDAVLKQFLDALEWWARETEVAGADDDPPA